MASYLVRSGSSPLELPRKKKTSKVDTADKAAPQNSVAFIYQTRIADSCRSVIVTCLQNPTDHSLCINLDDSSEEHKSSCKIDLKSRQSWGKKGLKSLELEGKRVDVFWDFRQAKFSFDPQPLSDYYVALINKKEVLLILGGLVKDAIMIYWGGFSESHIECGYARWEAYNPIFWDVHDWLFNDPGSGHGFFIFKPGSLESASLKQVRITMEMTR